MRIRTEMREGVRVRRVCQAQFDGGANYLTSDVSFFQEPSTHTSFIHVCVYSTQARHLDTGVNSSTQTKVASKATLFDTSIELGLADVRDLHLIAPVPWHRVHRQHSLTLVRSMSVIATPVQLASGHQMARAPRARNRGCTLSFSSSSHWCINVSSHALSKSMCESTCAKARRCSQRHGH